MGIAIALGVIMLCLFPSAELGEAVPRGGASGEAQQIGDASDPCLPPAPACDILHERGFRRAPALPRRLVSAAH